jgi:plasmid maintenance system antidote protein VapI
MAIRLSKAFGSTPETWLKMQLAHDLADAQKKAGSIEVRHYRPHEARPYTVRN